MMMKITTVLVVCVCSVNVLTGLDIATQIEEIQQQRNEDAGNLRTKPGPALVDLLRRILKEERNLDAMAINNGKENNEDLDIETAAEPQDRGLNPETRMASTCNHDNNYRTMDGRCNNMNNPHWGSTNQPYIRVAESAYDDGSFVPRLKDSVGNVLPSPRAVSGVVHPGINQVSRDDTVMVMQWGQFLSHDISITPLLAKPAAYGCCDDHTTKSVHKDVYNGGPCFPITIPEKDRHFTKSCMEFRRSTPAPNQSPREQLNALTAFIDGSVVYGNSKEQMNNLRNGAYMKTKGDNLLPESKATKCRITSSDEWCFDAGDARVNVFPGLALLHTVFVREHNRLVKLLTDALPTNTPEDVLFQEARKIVSALLQQVTYGEWLPLIIGPDAMEKYKLDINAAYVYSSTLNPTVQNVFATAAFRYGHSEVPRFLRLGGRVVPIEELFFRNTELIRDLDAVLESLLLDKRQQTDRFVTTGMTDHLFETSDQNSFDIVSLNVQRGRDHGLPPYNSFRRACNLPEVTSFDDDVFGGAGSSMKGIYSFPADIDVFTGLISEVPVRGGSVGPLLACLLGQQFHALKFGDSFWYQTTDTKKGFTKDQLKEIQQVTLARILCDNSGLNSIQKNPLKLAAMKRNPVVLCDDLPTIDISKWRK